MRTGYDFAGGVRGKHCGIILHIARRDEWEKAKESGSYRADTLESQGFIHCSMPEQVISVANFLFPGQSNLVLLCINSRKVGAEIRHETLEGGDKLFPHIYGPLNVGAVVKVVNLKPQSDGTFVMPKGFEQLM